MTVLERVTELVISISSFEINKNAQHGPSTKLSKRILRISFFVALVGILVKKDVYRNQRAYCIRMLLHRINYDLLSCIFYLIADILVKLVNSSVRSTDYDCSPNNLEITQSTLSRVSSLQNINQSI